MGNCSSKRAITSGERPTSERGENNNNSLNNLEEDEKGKVLSQ